jgi:hypothetical protein
MAKRRVKFHPLGAIRFWRLSAVCVGWFCLVLLNSGYRVNSTANVQFSETESQTNLKIFHMTYIV